MSKSICFTEKRIRKASNINPEVQKVRAIDSIKIHRQLKGPSIQAPRFSRNSQLLSAKKNNTENLPMWGTAIDIEI